MPKPHLEVAEILRLHIAEYRNAYPLAPDQYRIVSHLLHCRTPTLEATSSAALTAAPSVSSIIPAAIDTAQVPAHPRERWLEKRQSELLPIPYFHIVFTSP